MSELEKRGGDVSAAESQLEVHAAASCQASAEEDIAKHHYDKAKRRWDPELKKWVEVEDEGECEDDKRK